MQWSKAKKHRQLTAILTVTARFQKGLRKSFPGRTIHSLPQRQAQLQRISQTVPDVMSW